MINKNIGFYLESNFLMASDPTCMDCLTFAGNATGYTKTYPLNLKLLTNLTIDPEMMSAITVYPGTSITELLISVRDGEGCADGMNASLGIRLQGHRVRHAHQGRERVHQHPQGEPHVQCFHQPRHLRQHDGQHGGPGQARLKARSVLAFKRECGYDSDTRFICAGTVLRQMGEVFPRHVVFISPVQKMNFSTAFTMLDQLVFNVTGGEGKVRSRDPIVML